MTPETGSIEWLDLDTGEEIRWTGRPGAYPLVPFLVIGVGVGLFGLFLASLLTSPSSPFRFVLIGLFIGLGLFVAGWRSAEHRSVAYAITTDAVYEKRGSAAADVSRTPLAAVESASVEQSALAGALGRGTVRCYAPAADRTTLTLDGIEGPDEVHTLLTEHLGPTDTDRDDIDANSGTVGADSDMTGTDPGPTGVDRHPTDTTDTTDDTVRAYVVDATDDAVLLRAFTDGPSADLDRGRRVSLTIRPGSDADPDTRPTAPDASDGDPGSDRTFEPSDDRHVGRGGAEENDETHADQFVWGSGSVGGGTSENDRGHSDSDSDHDRDVGTDSDR